MVISTVAKKLRNVGVKLEYHVHQVFAFGQVIGMCIKGQTSVGYMEKLIISFMLHLVCNQ